jgi:tRNA nucleotidyltransferase (CCA-adding enzyme)
VTSKLRPEPPPAVRWITRTLEEAGFETWAVGGAVRDALLGHVSGEWDLATRAPPRRVQALFRRTVPVGVEHGTVGVLARDGTLYEVTTFRRDVETDGRHAVVVFADTIEEDLARRDFTINAVAWHPSREVLLDPFGGADDLAAGLLRTVGAPRERFSEDYLRILRAIRFAGLFDLTIDQKTWTALCASVQRLTTLSPERIRDELLKILDVDPRPGDALRLYASSGVLGVLYPELDALRTEPSDGAAWTSVLETVDRLPPGRPDLRLAALLRPVREEDAAALLIRLRLSNARLDEIARIARAESLPHPDADPAEIRRWLSRLGPHRVSAVARIDLAAARANFDRHGADRCGEVVSSWRRVREIRREAPPLVVSSLAIDGRDLISMGFKPGPHFGSTLDALLDWVLADPSRNEPEMLRRRAMALLEAPARAGGEANQGSGAGPTRNDGGTAGHG